MRIVSGEQDTFFHFLYYLLLRLRMFGVFSVCGCRLAFFVVVVVVFLFVCFPESVLWIFSGNSPAILGFIVFY